MAAGVETRVPFLDTELIKGTLSLLILSLLSRGAMYGYEIVTVVGEETDGAFRTV